MPDRVEEEVEEEGEIGVLRREEGARLVGMVGECVMSMFRHHATERGKGVVVRDGVSVRAATGVGVEVGAGTEA